MDGIKHSGRFAEMERLVNDYFNCASLQRANVTLGMCSSFAQAVPVDKSLTIDFRSVMGVELPTVSALLPQCLLP